MTAMKYALFIVCTVTTFQAAAQPPGRNVSREIGLLKNTLIQQHVEPKAIDDSFSEDLFNKLLTDLDPDKMFFTEADVAWLAPFRTALDDQINGKETGFLNRLKERYRSGLERSEKLIETMLASPLDWKSDETFDPVAGWAQDESALSDRHRQWLKHQILDRLMDVMDRDTVVQADFFDQNIASATDYVQLTALRPVSRLLGNSATLDNELSTAFLQAITRVFDPHSDFFSSHDFQDFLASLSTEDFYFGFTLDEDEKGNIIISALAPGGAAWKSGALHVSDVLLGIKWLDGEPIDIRGMDIEDVNEMLESGASDILEMTVRSLDGTEKTVALRKEKLEQEENVVQSFILEGDIKTGYIYLPDFYTRWDDEQAGGRCANDVAKEIIKLKKEGIEGLILDLRFNGGGSLYEARAMAGIFIDEGPLVVVSTREQKGLTLKDMNRGTVYDGPLVIMVNGGSASASEVLAGTIQDYNRGLIVGSQTYGKATGQNIFPLEGAAPGVSVSKNPERNTGYVKVTTQRLYRVTGGSAQGKGVIPDVVLPDIFMALSLRESAQPFALQHDSIPKNTYYKPLKPFDRRALQENSRNRISNHPVFRGLQETLTWLQEEMLRDSAPQSLVWDDYLQASMAKDEKKARADSQIETTEGIYEVNNSAAKQHRLAVDEYARSINERWIKVLKGDIYLQETYHILRDQINSTKKL
jgi:carboxyl-terminal processing protease